MEQDNPDYEKEPNSLKRKRRSMKRKEFNNQKGNLKQLCIITVLCSSKN